MESRVDTLPFAFTLADIAATIAVGLTVLGSIAGMIFGIGRHHQVHKDLENRLSTLEAEHAEVNSGCPQVESLSMELAELKAVLQKLDEKGDIRALQLNRIIGFLSAGGKFNL